MRNELTPAVQVANHVAERSLADLASLVKKCHAESEQATTHGLDRANTVGGYLIEAKRRLPHGSFSRWVKETCGIAGCTARKYMKIHRRFAELGLAKRSPGSVLTINQAAEILTDRGDEPGEDADEQPDPTETKAQGNSVPRHDQPDGDHDEPADADHSAAAETEPAEPYYEHDDEPEPPEPAPPPQETVYRDANGRRVPDHLKDTWAAIGWLDEQARLLKQLQTQARSYLSRNPFLMTSKLLPALEEAVSILDAAIPYVLQEDCTAAGCTGCRNVGWLPQWRDEENETHGVY